MSNPKSQNVSVDLEHAQYKILIGEGILNRLPDRLKSFNVSHVISVSDETVEQIYGDEIQRIFKSQDSFRFDKLTFPAGESSKCVEMANVLWQKMRACGADRKTMVVAIGGGVTGDLAGFLAATYGRGVPFYQVPTTLLAQVDSSVGGKVGINLPDAKNMIGAFWQPKEVLIDVKVLETLEDREYRAGLAEVIKYGVILDEKFFEFLEVNVEKINARDQGTLVEIVKRCCELKAIVVQEDERETTGRRAILNYGHTFGHALEAETGYTELLHGEGVSIGMNCAAKLSIMLDRIDQSMADRQCRLLESLMLPVKVPELDLEKVVAAMSRDKKVEHGKLRFVLPTKIGHVELVADVEHKLILDSMS